MNESRRPLTTRALLVLLLLFPASACSSEGLADYVARLDENGLATSPGANGHWLLTSELRHLAAGPYWSADAARVSRAARKDWADPLPAIVDFHEQLAAAGIPLVVAPVPAKAAVVSGALPEGIDLVDPGAADQAFLSVLADAGVRVVDLRAVLGEDGAGYCRTDSHWSPAGIERAAAAIADELVRLGVEPGALETGTSQRDIEVRGDLAKLPGGEDVPTERLPIRFVGVPADPEGRPIAPDPESPVLLLADSHGLVFHAGGDMLARGAGLPDQLALALGQPVDLVAVRGAASNAARMALLRRGADALADKRAVVWVFSVRELSQSSQGWRKLPLGLASE